MATKAVQFKIDEFDERREALELDIRNFLRDRGWEYTSDTPGCIWMFQKRVPDGRVILCEANVALRFEEYADLMAK